jgi:hypothetical protein
MQLALSDWGGPYMKSMVIICHDSVGIGKGWRSPGDLTLSVLACWHIMQD